MRKRRGGRMNGWTEGMEGHWAEEKGGWRRIWARLLVNAKWRGMVMGGHDDFDKTDWNSDISHICNLEVVFENPTPRILRSAFLTSYTNLSIDLFSLASSGLNYSDSMSRKFIVHKRSFQVCLAIFLTFTVLILRSLKFRIFPGIFILLPLLLFPHLPSPQPIRKTPFPRSRE